MNRKKFYAALGKHTQEQVNGQEAILDEAIRRGTSLQHLAYILATAKHETGGSFGPTTENLNYTTVKRIRAVWPKRFPTDASAAPYVKNPRALAGKVYGDRKDLGNTGVLDGWHFRGRGLAQITGRGNYAKWGLTEATADKALELPTAVRILFDGLTKGMFTGKKLSDYDNYKDMRQAINGDGALNGATIAGYAMQYEKALREAGYGSVTRPIGEAGAVVVPVVVGLASGDWLPWLIVAGIVLAVTVAVRVLKK